MSSRESKIVRNIRYRVVGGWAFVEKISSRTAIRPVTVKVAVLANQLPADYSSDPCDRLIGATALAEGIPLVTNSNPRVQADQDNLVSAGRKSLSRRMMFLPEPPCVSPKPARRGDPPSMNA